MQGNIQKAWGEICNTWNSTELVAIIHKDGKNTGTNCIKKDLNEPDYYNGVVSHPEPDVLECKVKRALRSTLLIKLVDVMKFQEVTHTESQFPYV